jgi:MFS family permease
MMRRAFPAWALTIAVILTLQTTSSYLTRLVPILSPAFMEEFGWNVSSIGYLTAANTVGALVVLASGTALIRWIGPVLALQITLLIGAASLALFSFPSFALALIASFLIGLSNGTATPTGSEVLQRVTSDANRNLVFSIKQAGVPLGGVLAGLTIPPLAEWIGWRIALVVAGAAVVVATALMWPFQRRIDGARDRSGSFTGLSSFRDLAVPLRSLTSRPGLLTVSIAGAMMAIAQACWFTFTVTYLAVGLGWSLSVAGLVFAVMQATGTIGRIMMGWTADRIGSGTLTLTILAVASGIATALLGLTGPAWPLWALVLLAAVGGVAVAGWNGVQIAEVARRSPPELIGETAAGSVILVFLSNMLAPIAFAAFVAATGRFDYAFMIAGACSLVCVPLLRRAERATSSAQ